MSKTKYPPGLCYKNCIDWAEKNYKRFTTLRIVHGFPVSGTDLFPTQLNIAGHAWIEWRGTCYDPHLDRKMPKEEYYAKYRIDPTLCRYYTLEEATTQVCVHSNYGPWHDAPPGTVYRPPN